MMDLTELKKTARHAAFARRKTAHAGVRGTESALLSELLAGYRGASLSGYPPIRTEIDPLPAMAEAAAHGVVAVPVIMGAGLPLCFSRWSPGIALRAGPFGASVPENDDFMEPESLIVPLVAFDGEGVRLGYGGGFYYRTREMLRRKRPTLSV